MSVATLRLLRGGRDVELSGRDEGPATGVSSIDRMYDRDYRKKGICGREHVHDEMTRRGGT